ncbi:MAG: hypothetical protein GVY27_09665, partial [Deinococcus-Thermus bacterium]|nr:hypothetical protein [Deinococcota bacterium]
AGLRLAEDNAGLEAGLRLLAAARADGDTAAPDPAQEAPAEMIAALAERAAALDRRERALAEREHAIAMAEEKTSDNLRALEAAERALRETVALADGAAAEDLDQLTRMYETMKPKEAAALFEQMDPAFAAGFLGQMRPAAAAEIMAGLRPETAYTVSLVLAGRNMGVPTE